jgi:hypothetical protein
VVGILHPFLPGRPEKGAGVHCVYPRAEIQRQKKALRPALTQPVGFPPAGNPSRGCSAPLFSLDFPLRLIYWAYWVQALQGASRHSRSLKGNLVQIEDGPAAVTLAAGMLPTEPFQARMPLH